MRYWMSKTKSSWEKEHLAYIMLLKDFFVFYMPPAHFFLIEIRGMKFVYSVIIARVAMLDQDNPQS